MRLFFGILFLFGFCLVCNAQSFKSRNIKLDTTRLEHNVEIIGAIDTTEVWVYEQMLLKHNGKLILFDTTTFYFFQKTEYPLLIENSGNSFDLLLETDGRPQSNTLTWMKIKNDSVLQRLNLPMFVSGTAANLDSDSALEYASSMGFPEFGGTYLPYSPIVYYELLPGGLTLDSSLTKERNAIIYGSFYGFSYLEDQHQAVTRMKIYDLEIKRIGLVAEIEATRLSLLRLNGKPDVH